MTYSHKKVVFIVILLVVAGVCALIISTSHKRDIGIPQADQSVTATTSDNSNVPNPNTDLTEDVIVLSERYGAFTHYPGKGPGGLVLSIVDLHNGARVKVNTLFPALPENAEYVSKDVLLPHTNTESTVLLTFRTSPFAPDHEREEFGGFPGDQLVILDFAQLDSRTIDASDPHVAFLPASYSTDGHYILLKKYILTTISENDQPACWQQQIPCVKCLASQGYSVLSITDNILQDFQDESKLLEWQDTHSIYFPEGVQTLMYETCTEGEM